LKKRAIKMKFAKKVMKFFGAIKLVHTFFSLLRSCKKLEKMLEYDDLCKKFYKYKHEIASKC